MKRFIEGEDRGQSTLFPERLDEYIGEDNPVRVIDVFVDELDLGGLGFVRVEPQATGRPAYHPSVLLKLYIYGYLNRVQSSRRLEREAGRNVEVMWLTGRLVPDHKTIADFRKDNGRAIRKVCARFVALCRRLDLFAEAIVAIDKNIDHPHRIVFTDPVIQSLRKQSALAAVFTLNETLHHKPSPVPWRDSIRPHVFTQPGSGRDIPRCYWLGLLLEVKQTKLERKRTSVLECLLSGVKQTYRRHGPDFRV